MNTVRIKIRLPLLIILSSFLSTGCKQSADDFIQLEGEAQGTTYHISFYAPDHRDHHTAIDSIFRKIDSSLSTYLPASLISRINRNEAGAEPDAHFLTVCKKAVEVAERTKGAFDITVAPVINAWGFGFSKKEKVDSAMIDSLLQFVGYKKIQLKDNRLVKENPGIMLDFNAIAQGYTVDVIAGFLEQNGIISYFIELGGEVKAKGKKKGDLFWKVGIDKPLEGDRQRELQSVLKLQDQALATSGNYRKFYEENGQKFSHIIDPATGYPAKNNILSASVVAGDCMTADAYATAFMVMGLEKAKKFLMENPGLGLGVFFIYDNNGAWKTYTSENLVKWMESLN